MSETLKEVETTEPSFNEEELRASLSHDESDTGKVATGPELLDDEAYPVVGVSNAPKPR